MLGFDQSCNESQMPPPPLSEIADNLILIHGLTLHNWRYLLWFKIEFIISDYFWRLFAIYTKIIHFCIFAAAKSLCSIIFQTYKSYDTL